MAAVLKQLGGVGPAVDQLIARPGAAGNKTMTLTVECKRIPGMRGSSNQNQQRTYTDSYKIKQTDSGSVASEADMIEAAQAVMTGDPLPLYGDNRTFRGTTDLDSYAQEYDWNWPEEIDYPKLLHVNVNFSPAQGVNPGKLVEPDPLMWPTEYWVEWTEEQVPLEKAYNVEELPGIERTALTLGPAVNACGVEFSEPIMKTVYYPVLHCQKQYEDLEDAVALNVTYQNTTNNSTFFGATKRSAKYLGTESGRIQKANNTSFYVGITRIWFKKTSTDGDGVVTGGWDRPILNNGYSHFKINTDAGGLPYFLDSHGRPMLFPNLINNEDDVNDPDAEGKERCSEPLSINVAGIIGADPNYITYRDLEEVDYSGIGIGG